jgi:hypothetical protein
VQAYVKNHNLGLEVPYRYGSETRRYLPDFIVLVDDGHGADDLLHLSVEIKGYRREDAKEKKATMETYWVPGVNNLGTYGRWAFAELTDVYQIQADFEAKVAAAFNQMIAVELKDKPPERSGMQFPNGEHAIVPLEKLRAYCLNPTHRVGGHKAHVFEAVLGLTATQAEELQQHLLAIARTGEAVLGIQNVYGQRYIIDFAMTTALGTAVVRSTWIVLVGQDVPRLTSCYIL